MKGQGFEPWARPWKIHYKTDFSKSVISFEPLELQRWEWTHFEAKDQLFLTVPNTRVLGLQERIRKQLKFDGLTNSVKGEKNFIRETFTVCTMRLKPTRPPDNCAGTEYCLRNVLKKNKIKIWQYSERKCTGNESEYKEQWQWRDSTIKGKKSIDIRVPRKTKWPC